MASVIAPKIKKESLLISSNYFWNPHITNFILCRQFNRPVHIQVRTWGRLTTVARNEASTYIIRKPNKTFWRFRTCLYATNRWRETKEKEKVWDPFRTGNNFTVKAGRRGVCAWKNRDTWLGSIKSLDASLISAKMFLNAAHPSSRVLPAGTMIVLRFLLTDASDTCPKKSIRATI